MEMEDLESAQTDCFSLIDVSASDDDFLLASSSGFFFFFDCLFPLSMYLSI